MTTYLGPSIITGHGCTRAGSGPRQQEGRWRGRTRQARARGRLDLPAEFRRALEEHGLFTLGKVTGATDHLCFAVWPLADHKPALAVLAEQLGCKATGAAVAEELGIEE